MQYDPVSMVFMWLYIFTSSIVLVNLLIAMFSKTYNRVSSLAEQEYQHMFFDKVQEHQHVLLALPPVLNLPYVWFDLVRMTCGSCLCRRTKKISKWQSTKEMKLLAAAADERSTTAGGL